MRPSQLIQSKRREILAISQQFSLNNVRVFGSIAKGLDTEASDVDLLVEPTDKTTLFGFGRIAWRESGCANAAQFAQNVPSAGGVRSQAVIRSKNVRTHASLFHH